jgi:hypothetical protein
MKLKVPAAMNIMREVERVTGKRVQLRISGFLSMVEENARLRFWRGEDQPRQYPNRGTGELTTALFSTVKNV